MKKKLELIGVKNNHVEKSYPLNFPKVKFSKWSQRNNLKFLTEIIKEA